MTTNITTIHPNTFYTGVCYYEIIGTGLSLNNRYDIVSANDDSREISWNNIKEVSSVLYDNLNDTDTKITTFTNFLNPGKYYLRGYSSTGVTTIFSPFITVTDSPTITSILPSSISASSEIVSIRLTGSNLNHIKDISIRNRETNSLELVNFTYDNNDGSITINKIFGISNIEYTIHCTLNDDSTRDYTNVILTVITTSSPTPVITSNNSTEYNITFNSTSETKSFKVFGSNLTTVDTVKLASTSGQIIGNNGNEFTVIVPYLPNANYLVTVSSSSSNFTQNIGNLIVTNNIPVNTPAPSPTDTTDTTNTSTPAITSNTYNVEFTSTSETKSFKVLGSNLNSIDSIKVSNGIVVAQITANTGTELTVSIPYLVNGNYLVEAVAGSVYSASIGNLIVTNNIPVNTPAPSPGTTVNTDYSLLLNNINSSIQNLDIKDYSLFLNNISNGIINLTSSDYSEILTEILTEIKTAISSNNGGEVINYSETLTGIETSIKENAPVDYSNTLTDIKTSLDNISIPDYSNYLSSINSNLASSIPVDYSNTLTDIKTSLDNISIPDYSNYLSSINSNLASSIPVDYSEILGDIKDSLSGLVPINYSEVLTGIETSIKENTPVDYSNSLDTLNTTLTNLITAVTTLSTNLTTSLSNISGKIDNLCNIIYRETVTGEIVQNTIVGQIVKLNQSNESMANNIEHWHHDFHRVNKRLDAITLASLTHGDRVAPLRDTSLDLNEPNIKY